MRSDRLCHRCLRAITSSDKRAVYCSKSCAARSRTCRRTTKLRACRECGDEFNVNRLPCGDFSNRAYCEECLDRRLMNCDTIVSARTKGEMFAIGTWQHARTAIAKHARIVFRVYHQNACRVCGYDRHVEVCHIKPVSEFPDESLISQINDAVNLVGLCPTHHWEFDAGLLCIDDHGIAVK